MTTADSKSVGRFDQKLAAQRLFPSLSSWSPAPAAGAGRRGGAGLAHPAGHAPQLKKYKETQAFY
jgi:hypothetical protein